MVAASQSQSFPDLPLLDLQTAETTRTLREFVGKDTTVIGKRVSVRTGVSFRLAQVVVI